MKLYKIRDKTGFYKIVITSYDGKYSLVQVLKEDGSKCGSPSNFVGTFPQNLLDPHILIEDEIEEIESRIKFLKNLQQKICKIEK